MLLALASWAALEAAALLRIDLLGEPSKVPAFHREIRLHHGVYF